MMQRVFWSCLFALTLLSSCTTSHLAVSTKDYEDIVNAISANLEKDGFFLSGKEETSKSEVHVTDVSFTEHLGNGIATEKDLILTDVFTYIDSSNNQLTYKITRSDVKYSLSDNTPYYSDCSITGCSTSNPKKHELCNDIKTTFSSVKKMDNIVLNQPKKYGTIIGASSIVVLVVAFILL